jgi:hypothetical protein
MIEEPVVPRPHIPPEQTAIEIYLELGIYRQIWVSRSGWT